LAKPLFTDKEKLMRSYTWYVEPNDDFTNEYISRELPEEDALRDQECDDPLPHNLWRCESRFITKLKKSQQRLDYAVWIQEGNGKIRRWIPPRKKTAKIKRARDLAK